jgi:sodium transport system permease protein
MASLWLRLDRKTVFSLKPTSLGNLLLCVLIGLSLTILLEGMGYLQWRLIGVTSNKETSIFEMLRARGLADLGWIFFSFALIPAFCEEFLFRGFIFNRFKLPNQIAEAVMLSSVLFGVFHRDMSELFNNTVAGIVLSVILLRSGSLYNSLMAHTVMNTVAISVVNSETVQSIFRIGRKGHLPWVFLVTSVAGLIFGIRGLRSHKNMGRKKPA